MFKERVFDVLAARSMQALDDAKIPADGAKTIPLVLDRTDAVKISRNGADVTGKLLRVLDGDDGKTVKFETETGGLGE